MTICLFRRAALWLAVLLATVPAPAPAQARSSGFRNGFAPDRLARIDSMLDGKATGDDGIRQRASVGID